MLTMRSLNLISVQSWTYLIGSGLYAYVTDCFLDFRTVIFPVKNKKLWRIVFHQATSELRCAFDLHENETVGGTRFHKNGFTRRLVLTRRQKGYLEVAFVCVDTIINNSNPTSRF